MDTREGRLEKGTEYQDFLAKKLLKEGIVLVNYCSAKYQNEGENVGGFEIKYDTNFQETGNLYFETHGTWNENDRNPNWVARGVLKNDNTWMYLIGDETKVFFIPKNLLVRLYRQLEKGKVEGVKITSTNRSRGFIASIQFLKNRGFICKEIVFDEIEI